MAKSAGNLQVTFTGPPPELSAGSPPPRRTARQVLVAAAVLLVVTVGAAGFAGSLSYAANRGTPHARPARPGGTYGVARRASLGSFGAALHAGAGAGAGPPALATPARGDPAEAALANGARAQTRRSPAGTGPASAGGERIEETGALTVGVRAAQIQADIGRLMALAQGLGGFVASTETQSASSGSGSPAQGTVTLQVPVGGFATAVSDARGLGKVATLSTQAEDVTGQYVDLQAQITAAEDTRQQYLTIMAKAKTVGSVLAVQAQLDDVQSQLQQLQGELKQLSSETTYATLAVTLTQRALPPPPPRRVGSLLAAWRAAVGGFVAGFEAVVRVAGPLSFALLLVAALYLVGRYIWRLRRRRAAG